MKEKDLYKLFNQVKIEESEFEDIGEEVSEMQKERIKKNLNKKIKGRRNWKIFKYSSTAAAIALASLIGINTVSPSFAESIPLIGSIVQNLNEKRGVYGDYEEYLQIVNKSVEDKGIDVTINEVIADGSRLHIGYTIKSDLKFDNNLWPLDGISHITSDFKINGKDVYANSGMGEYVDDQTYLGSESIDISDLEMAEELNINLKIYNINDIEGSWDFSFTASREEISKETIVFNPDMEIEFQDSTVKVDKVEFSPIGTYIFISGDYKEEREEFSSSIFDYDYWLAYDDKGVELISNGIGSGTSGEVGSRDFHSQMQYGKIDHIPEYLTIVPLKITPTGGGGVMFDGDEEIAFEIETKEVKEVMEEVDGRYPKELVQGDFGKLIIHEVWADDSSTRVKFTAEGKAPQYQATRFKIKDDNGEDVKIINSDIRMDEDNLNEFEVQFEALDPNREYFFSTTDLNNVETEESMKFRIELKK